MSIIKDMVYTELQSLRNEKYGEIVKKSLTPINEEYSVNDLCAICNCIIKKIEEMISDKFLGGSK